MIVIGLAPAAAVDVIDAAAADIDLRADGTLHLRPLGHAAYPWPDALRRRVLAALPPAAVDMGEVCALDTLVGQELGAAARRAVDDLAGGDADLVASHGQDLHHWVVGGRARGTLQLGNPAWIAERARRPVVSDLRVADVAAGGQGAPLASMLDALWLGAEPGTAVRPTAALTVGAVANVTLVGAVGDPVLGWDTGPGTCLVDRAAQRIGAGTDGAAALAARGTVHAGALAALLDEEFYSLPVPRSAGPALFDDEHLRVRLASHGIGVADEPDGPDRSGGVPRTGGRAELGGADLVATLTELTAVTIARSLAAHGPAGGVERVVLSGDGARNQVLRERLAAHLEPGTSLVAADDLGLPADAKEAYLFALLGFLGVHGLPGTAPGPQRRQATGARRPVVLGSLTPPTPLAVPAVRPPVRRLVLSTSPQALLTSPRGSQR